jgi:hypothetical protein
MICSNVIKDVVLAATELADNKAVPPRLRVTVEEVPAVLVIAILFIATATLVGDVYSVVLEVAAAPLYKVKDESAI